MAKKSSKKQKTKSKKESKKSKETFKIEIPKTLHIMGLPFLIEIKDLPTGLCGLCEPVEQIIYLSTKNHPTSLLPILLHEIMHALYCLLGLSGKDDEELIVTSLATGLYQVIKDNDLRF